MRRSAYLEELTLQSDKLLEELCRRYGRGLDRDDARMEAAAELICAGKDYKKVQGCYEFWDYVTGRVVQRLELKRKEANRIRKVESGYSLDQPVAEGEEAARDVFFPTQGDFVNGVVLTDYVNGLPDMDRTVAWDYINGYTDQEILGWRRLSFQDLEGIKGRLRLKMEQYLSI